MAEALNSPARVVLSPGEGETVWLRKLGIRFMIGGEVGFHIGEEVLVARPGDLVFKPRGIPHAFWNATDELARALEIISPAGFERYFAELAPLFPPANQGQLDEEAVGAVREKYGLEIDMSSIPELAERHGLAIDAPPPPEK